MQCLQPSQDRKIVRHRDLIALYHLCDSIPTEAALKKLCISNCERLHYMTTFFTKRGFTFGFYAIYCLSYRTQLIVLLFVKIEEVLITECYRHF